MTDRYKGAVVVFDREIREDDAEALMTALSMLRGVVSVAPTLAGFEDAMVEMRRDAYWRKRLLDVVQNTDSRNSS